MGSKFGLKFCGWGVGCSCGYFSINVGQDLRAMMLQMIQVSRVIVSWEALCLHVLGLYLKKKDILSAIAMQR